MTQTASPLIGLGGSLSIGTQGGSPTYTVVAGVKQCKAPQGKWGTEDVTTLDNSDNTRRFIKTLVDEGEVDVMMLWESADPGQDALATAYGVPSNTANGAAYPFKFALPVDKAGGQTTTGDTYGFNALVTEIGRPEVQVDKSITWSVRLKVTGAVTLTEGS